MKKNPYNECDDCKLYYRCPYIQRDDTVDPDAEYCHPRHRVTHAVKAAGLPPKMSLVFHKDIEEHEGNAEMLDTLQDIFDTMGNESTQFNFNMIIHGKGCGTGKTMAGCAIINEFCAKKRKLYLPGDDPIAMYVDFSMLMERIKEAIDNPDDELKHYLYQIRTCHLLVVDDVGATRISDYVRDRAFTIFNERYLNERSTVLISNYDPGTLEHEAYLGARIVSRLSEDGFIVEVTGTDRRKLKRRQ